MVAILPLHLIGLIGSWMASKFAVVVIFGQSAGTYDHYFNTFISGRDVLLSVIKILVFALLVSVIHCWFGFNASGGPQGVGEATGRAIRASIVVVVLADMLLTLTFWGSSPGFRIQG
jgi:phospholipid/cholesterol/gamma-HCH transport system permease protein